MNVGTNYPEPSYYKIAHDADALEKNAEEYPFSSLARYLLLCQYRKTGHAGFENLLKKTILYFNNYHWLQFQLSQIKPEASGSGFVNENDFNAELQEHKSQNHFAVVTDEQLTMYQHSESISGEEEKFIPDTQSLGSHNEKYYETETQPGYENVHQEIFHEDEISVPHTQTLGTHLENIGGTELQDNYGNVHGEIIHKEEMPVPDTQSLGSHDENIQETENSGHIDSFENKPGKVVSPDQLTEIQNSDTTEAIAFEPLHTVDYFASQGIRITDEALTNDKLGTQMKSFTDWLKSMKKLHPSKLPEPDSLAEDIIQSAAEVSNIDTEVLTEAMAEVLIKQDKKDKAIEMYNKLSLINPSKSAYFAAKIESIKST